MRLIEGDGFPSSNRAIARFYLGTHDPNGYYDLLDLDPRCSPQELKERYRELVRKFHPDGSHPNVETFREINEIYLILSDPTTRAEYNRISGDGEIFIGPLEAERIFKIARTKGISVEKIAQLIEKKETLGFYDFMAEDDSWCSRAQQWYGYLLDAAYLYRFVGILRVGVDRLEFPCKAVRKLGYLIFWFDSTTEPNFITAFCAVSLVTEFSWQKGK